MIEGSPMSATCGPCPKCGKQTTYDCYEPTICSDCKGIVAAVRNAQEALSASAIANKFGNRKARRAEKAKGRKA